MIAGIVLFGVTVLFQLINLPVEFDASARAKRILVDQGIITQTEAGPVAKTSTAELIRIVQGASHGLARAEGA